MVPHSTHSRRIAAVALSALLLLSCLSGVAAAQSAQQTGSTIVVEEGETVDSIEGVAGTIVVRGTVTGDLSGSAGSIRITETGEVGGDLQGAAGSIIVAGTVGGDVQVGGGSFDLTNTGQIGGSLDVGGGSITVDGTVGGNVRAGGDSVTLGPNADVGGEFRYDAEEFTRSDDATVSGEIVEDPSLRGETSGFALGSLPSWAGTVYGFATSLLLGGLLLLLSPRFSAGVAARVSDAPVTAGGVGLLTLVAVPILLVLLAVTIVGIPLSIAGLAVYVLALWVASVYGKYAVGSWVLGQAGQENRWLALLVGLVGFLLLGLIPVVGGVAELVALLLGLGAVAVGLRDRYNERPSESVDATATD